MLVDSHCHLHLLDLNEYNHDLKNLLTQTQQMGVSHLLSVAIDTKSSEKAQHIAQCFDGVYASVGVHPSDVTKANINWSYLRALAQHPKVIAIGETGLDYYYNQSGLKQQCEAFRQHIHLAQELKKPLIIHSRSAREDTIRILQEEQACQVKGVMHCFTESLAMAEQAMELGFYISFSGIITFKNAQTIAEVATQIPLERILIETDAPYLAPVPYRGKSNYPQYVRYVAEKIAALKQLPFEQVAMQTTKNFFTLFLPHL